MVTPFSHSHRVHGRLPWRGEDRAGGRLAVRVAVPHDALEYLAHMGRLVTETHYMLQCEDDPLPAVQGQRRLLEQLDHSETSLGLVAYRPDAPRSVRIVGSLTLLGGRSGRTRHCCSLGMGVDRSDWGLGVGGLLLDAALLWARENPLLTRVGLQLFPDNAVARSLYRSRGFSEEGLMRREVLVRGTYLPLLGMALETGGGAA